MNYLFKAFYCFYFLIQFASASLPPAPDLASHPGSKIYSYTMGSKIVECNRREIVAFFPKVKNNQESFPVIIYGHGQALKIENYKGTLEHLAKKGIIALFPAYDTGFFDWDWRRMARDYVSLSKCALKKLAEENLTNANLDQVIFSGHSKGAYVAGVAAGLSSLDKLALRPKGVLLFEPAGLDEEANASVDKEVLYNVVYSDQDKVVSRKIAEDIYNQVSASKKQFIFVKSYPELAAGHFWPLTKPSPFGGTDENAYHYYSSWKWLVALVRDVSVGGLGIDNYLFGEEASSKGSPNIRDAITRSW